MIKSFKYYIAAWLVLLVVYNVCVFVIPEGTLGINCSTKAFWWGYAFALIAFTGHLICSYIVFKSENSKKFFLRIPLLQLSWSAFVLCCLGSFAGLFVKELPVWAVIVANTLILSFYTYSIICSEAAIDIVETVEQRIGTKTSFIRELTLLSQNLKTMADSGNEDIINEVYEEIRYSDPMSSDSLATVESALKAKFNELSNAVMNKDNEKIKFLANEVVVLAKQRNNLCKAAK